MPMNIMDKKAGISVILDKMNKPNENSADELKANNEQVAETPLPENEEVDASVAQEAAAASLSHAIATNDSKAIAEAIKELFELWSLGAGR